MRWDKMREEKMRGDKCECVSCLLLSRGTRENNGSKHRCSEEEKRMIGAGVAKR